jgi:hypothetical protein
MLRKTALLTEILEKKKNNKFFIDNIPPWREHFLEYFDIELFHYKALNA